MEDNGTKIAERLCKLRKGYAELEILKAEACEEQLAVLERISERLRELEAALEGSTPGTAWH
jgi:hypothetical protein